MNVEKSSYDEDILIELCERVSDKHEDLTLKNFLIVFIEAETLLKNKIE